MPKFISNLKEPSTYLLHLYKRTFFIEFSLYYDTIQMVADTNFKENGSEINIIVNNYLDSIPELLFIDLISNTILSLIEKGVIIVYVNDE